MVCLDKGNCLPCKFANRKVFPVQNGNHLATRVYYELTHLTKQQKAATANQVLLELRNQDDWFQTQLKIVEAALEWLVKMRFAKRMGGTVHRYKAVTNCGCVPDPYRDKPRRSQRLLNKAAKKGEPADR